MWKRYTTKVAYLKRVIILRTTRTSMKIALIVAKKMSLQNQRIYTKAKSKFKISLSEPATKTHLSGESKSIN